MPESEFPAIHSRLRSILEPYAPKMYVSADDATWYGLDFAPEPERGPVTFFGAVRLGKAYVSYYLMPVYVDPGLLEDMSPELKQRMQGKSCFNFKRMDEALFAELTALTARGYERTGGNADWGNRERERHKAQATR